MPTLDRSLSISIACVVCLLAMVVQTAVHSDPADSGKGGTGHSSNAPFVSTRGWETVDFEHVGDMEPVGAQGAAVFAWLWHGAVDSDTEGSGRFANESSSDTVAMLWDNPIEASQTRISFPRPVQAVFFDYALDTTFGALAVIAYDEYGAPLRRLPLDVCGAVSCGADCYGDPTGELCDFSTIEIIAQPGRGISHIEFDGPPDSLARFALDDLTYFIIHPIFVDGFETGDTARWFDAVGLPPPCNDIEVGPLTWLSDNQVRIETVKNHIATHPVVHTRTRVNWDKYRPDIYLNDIYFNDIPFIASMIDATPPTDLEVEIPLDPDQSSRLTVSWNGWPYPYCPLGGEIEVTLYFRYSQSNGLCSETRSVYREPPATCPHDTPTPTPTATNTHTPTRTPIESQLTPTPKGARL